jgi:hypothetical protein
MKFTVFNTSVVGESFPPAWRDRFPKEFEEDGRWHARVIVMTKKPGEKPKIHVIARRRAQDEDQVRADVQARFPEAQYVELETILEHIGE